MSYHIFGKVENQLVRFVGCAKSDVPADSILLQTVPDHPELHWSSGRCDFVGH